MNTNNVGDLYDAAFMAYIGSRQSFSDDFIGQFYVGLGMAYTWGGPIHHVTFDFGAKYKAAYYIGAVGLFVGVNGRYGLGLSEPVTYQPNFKLSLNNWIFDVEGGLSLRF